MKKIIILSFLIAFQFTKAQETPKRFSLQEAIDYAIKNSYDNQKAEKNIEKAKAVKWETTATGLPQIDGTIDYKNWLKQNVTLLPAKMVDPRAREGEFVPMTFGTKQSMGASVTLKQLIFSGSYLVGLQSAKTYLKISEQAKTKTELNTKEAVVNAYGNVLVANKSVEILERNKKNIEKMLHETKEIYKNGFTEQESVEQLEITLGMLENNLRNAKRMSLIASQMLNIALGNKSNQKLILTDSLENLTEKIDLELLSKKFNLDENIDYQIAMNDRKSKSLLLKLEKTKYLPTLSGFVNYSVNANSNEFTFFDSEQNWFKSSLFGINLSVPIFSSFGRTAKMKQARISNLATAKKNLKLAERIEKKNQTKFKEGISSSFDLLQAQNQLYTQQNNYIQAMLNVIAKKAKLEVVLGKN
ncbi:MAG: transporter [Polaribacter sp.]|nr:MAG: transporter [Polaribacter sp.]